MTKLLPFYVRESDPPAKREILRAAMKLFAERGLAATSIRDIADESGYTNPALYKHFAGKEGLAIHLFETCHARVWASLSAALASGSDFDSKLDAYVGCWLELMTEHPDTIAFLADSSRVLWPKSNRRIRRQTLIGLARALALEAPRSTRPRIDPDIAAASLQGSLAEVARMIQVGVLEGPATRHKGALLALFQRLVA